MEHPRGLEQAPTGNNLELEGVMGTLSAPETAAEMAGDQCRAGR